MLHGLLIAETDPEDFRFLAESLTDGLVRDLDRELESPEVPVSLVWSMLWEGARLGRFGAGCPKLVRFRFAGSEFAMKLDLAESPECGYLRRNPAPHITRLVAQGGRTMLDIGANAGFHALCATSTFGTVHAFEPVPQTAARLRANVAASGLDAKVSVHETALSDREGSISMKIEPGHCGANRIAGDGDDCSIEVPMGTLDRIAERDSIRDVDLVKIDVEGHERSVIAGGAGLVARDLPRIVVELGSVERYRAFRALLPEGYEARVPQRDGTTHPLAGESDAGRFRDLLFVHPRSGKPRP
jgi:FkbM family methyltransferase